MPHLYNSPEVSLIAVPLVAIFVLLFNAYRMGKCRRPLFIGGVVLILAIFILLLVWYFSKSP